MSILFRSAPRVEQRSSSAIPRNSETSAPNYVYRTADAMKVAAVVACVGMRAGAFAQLPLRAYRGDGGASSEVPSQPDLLVRPSATVVPAVWKTQMSISRDIWGYAAGLISAVDASGYASRVEWLCPGEQVRAEEQGSAIRWWVGGQPVDPSLILHVPSRWVLPGRPLGISPLEHSGLVELAKRAQDYGRDWFRNGATPSSIIYSDTPLDSTQADDLALTIWTKWRNRKPAVLGTGMRYEKISTPANESQFLETLRQVAADIAISFNLPPERINAATGGKNEYANISQNQQQYLLDSINPDLVVIQEAIERHTPRGQFVRFATGAFLRSDLKTRYESYQIGIGAGFLTADEARAWEDLPPLPSPSPDTLGGAA